MGAVMRFNCECGYNKTFYLGSGRSSGDISSIRSALPPEIKSEFDRSYKVGRAGSCFLNNILIRCTQCAELEQVRSFTFTDVNGEEIKYIASCPSCGKDCVPIDDIDKVVCPGCGKEMSCSRIGFWD